MKPSCQVGPEAAHLVWLTRDKAASILNVASDCASLDAPRDPLLLPPKYSVASSLVVPKGQANGEGERGWCEGGAGAEGGARVEGGGGCPMQVPHPSSLDLQQTLQLCGVSLQ